MDRAIRRPSPNLLPIKVQRNRTKEYTTNVQSQDSHERTNIPIPHNPIVEIPRHPIAKQILEDRGADQKLAGRRLVAIDLEDWKKIMSVAWIRLLSKRSTRILTT
jgi:hypothetical protein